VYRTRPRYPAVLRTILWVLALTAPWGTRPAAAQNVDQTNLMPDGEVTVACSNFGVGGVVRPGEWAALRLIVKDSADRPRDVLLRITLTDADGDRPYYETRITTNPGVPLPIWHYVYLPAQFRQNDVVELTAFAAVEESGPGGGFSAGRLLQRAKFGPTGIFPGTAGFFAVAGTRPLGLERYSGVSGQDAGLPTGHERTFSVTDLKPESFPDRWHGLRQFDVIFWNDPPPGGLGSDRAQAIREWVQRGGHLVVVLPRVGQTWTDEANNPLFDITPRVSVSRREGVDMAPYRALLTREPLQRSDNPSPARAMPSREVLQTFKPLNGAAPAEATCILAGFEHDAGQGREWLVARRTVGAGRVDLVGVDVASAAMRQGAGLPDPETFWHRILGRRGHLISNAEFSARNSGRGGGFSSWGREPVTIDRDIGPQIAMGESAAAGVLMGLVVFILYWLAAGPGGYALLRRAGQVRHSWLGFVAAAGAFTALAWGGATAIRPATLKAQHLSIIDHVYNPSMAGSMQRARSWVTLLIPQYGEATVSVGDPALRAASVLRNTIAPWESEGASAGAFPDARGYRVDARQPDRITFPARSTVKQFVVDWAGGSKFKMIRPVPLPGAEPGTPDIRIETRDQHEVLRGMLTHDLPGPLKDVRIMLIRQQRDIGPVPPITAAFLPLVQNSYMDALPDDWNPGEPIDLSALGIVAPTGTNATSRAVWSVMKAISEGVGRGDSADSMDVSTSRSLSRLLAMSFFNQLDPPTIEAENRVNIVVQAQRLLQRRFTHGMDLSAWFTQPCLVVIGRLEPRAGGECPAPLFVSTGGSFREVPTDGTTLVRWVYPLPADPPVFSTSASASGDEPLPAEVTPAEPEQPAPIRRRR
jgi:hypothetical protein